MGMLEDVLCVVKDDAHELCTLEPRTAPLMRLALGIEYLGEHYHGWQVQPTVDSVQARLQHALSVIADHPVGLVCAGRTDRGVHATLQVAHFETHAVRNMQAWQRGVLAHLPKDIGVLWVCTVDHGFHARFSATQRRYRYVLYNASHRPGLLHGRVSWYPMPLDVDLMQLAAVQLLGTQDFSSFRGKDCQAHSPIRTLHELNIQREGDYIYFDLCANAFLLHMVRNIVGTLLRVGEGKCPPEWVAEVLATRRREVAGVTAPPDGLYLVHVNYPVEYGLPNAVRLPRFY